MRNLARKRRLQGARMLYPTKAEHMQPMRKSDTAPRHWPARVLPDGRYMADGHVVVWHKRREAYLRAEYSVDG